jgi:hypothetical protein
LNKGYYFVEIDIPLLKKGGNEIENNKRFFTDETTK